MRLCSMLLLGSAFLSMITGSAGAYDWRSHGYAGCGYAGYWAGWVTGPRSYTSQDIPYFAKHPPVYYSHPIARPYGYFPYAYLPAADTRAAVTVVVVTPEVVRNPYVTGEAVERKAEKLGPLRIVNPFAHEPSDPLPVPEELPPSDPSA